VLGISFRVKNIMKTNSNKTMMQLLNQLWPLHRTINSDDLDKAFKLCDSYIKNGSLTMHNYKPGRDVLSWIVPPRYHVHNAWLEIDGNRVADFKKNSLHLLSYSMPKKITGKLKDIKKNIWTSKKRPDAIPWEFKYYERSWGFCMPHNELIKYKDSSKVEGLIDVSFGDEPMRVGEYYIKGETNQDILFMTNICHPNQVNDSISGLVVALEFANKLSLRKKSKYGLRVLVVPETIGTVAWFSENNDKVKNIKYAWFCEMVGHQNSFILQKSFQGDSQIDRAFLLAMKVYSKNKKPRTGKFRTVVASDEVVSNGPGYNIPSPSITRWPYDEYHTSDDNPKIIKNKNLEQTVALLDEVWKIINASYTPKRKFKGPLMLSRYGLWVDWRENKELNLKTEEIMFMLEGDKSLIDIAYELDLSFIDVKNYVNKMLDKQLVEIVGND